MANNNAAASSEIKAKIPTRRRFTLLHEGVMNEQVLPQLLERIKKGEMKVDVSGGNERNETPLHYAMYHKKVYAIEPLINAGANVNKATIGGDTPLSLGIQANASQAVKTLIDVCKAKGINLKLNKGNLFGETPLHWACCYGRLALVKLLVEAGANVNAKTETGETPLSMAKQNKQNECAEYLESKGATASEAYKPKDTPKNLPSLFADGFVKNEWEQEMRFGGALWGEKIEFFYPGKKPRPGYAVAISTNFSAPQKGKKGSTLWGFIRTVANDKKSFEATVKLNVDHESVFPELNKNWNAKVEWDPFKQNPWVLISLTPIDAQAEPNKTWDKVLEAALEHEKTYGRKITKEPQGSFAEMQGGHGGHSHSHDHGGHDHGHSHGHGEECNDSDHSHGHSHGHDEECDHDHEHEHDEECDHDHDDEHGGHGHSHSHGHGGHDHSHGHGHEMPEEMHWVLQNDVKPGMDLTNIKVIAAFHIESFMQVEYTFADGSKKTTRDPEKVPFLIQMMIMKNEKANSEGRGRVPLTFSQAFREFAVSMNMLSEDDLNEIGNEK